MILQLPNGRIIELSVEQYLDLTDEDIKEELFYRNCNFVEFGGNWDARFYKSIEIINKEFNI